MKRYRAARSMNAMITLLGWGAIAAAALVGTGGYGILGTAVAWTVSIPLGIGGLILIAAAQLTSAQLDTAECAARTAEAVERLIAVQERGAARAQHSAAPSAKIEPPMRGPVRK